MGDAPNGDRASADMLAKVSVIIFRSLTVCLLAVMAFFGQRLYDKIDGSASVAVVDARAAAIKADADRANSELWKAIGNATTAQATLATNLAVLQANFESHKQSYATEETAVRNTLADIQNRLQGIKR